ncbi:MAG: zinc finger MYND domain-containing protein [Chlamydiales bacterium]
MVSPASNIFSEDLNYSLNDGFPNAKNACNYCKKEERSYDKKTQEVFKVCGKCRVAMYCSKKCQRSDWKEHKKICKVDPSEEKKAIHRIKSARVQTACDAVFQPLPRSISSSAPGMFLLNFSLGQINNIIETSRNDLVLLINDTKIPSILQKNPILEQKVKEAIELLDKSKENLEAYWKHNLDDSEASHSNLNNLSISIEVLGKKMKEIKDFNCENSEEFSEAFSSYFANLFSLIDTLAIFAQAMKKISRNAT